MSWTSSQSIVYTRMVNQVGFVSSYRMAHSNQSISFMCVCVCVKWRGETSLFRRIWWRAFFWDHSNWSLFCLFRYISNGMLTLPHESPFHSWDLPGFFTISFKLHKSPTIGNPGATAESYAWIGAPPGVQQRIELPYNLGFAQPSLFLSLMCKGCSEKGL